MNLHDGLTAFRVRQDVRKIRRTSTRAGGYEATTMFGTSLLRTAAVAGLAIAATTFIAPRPASADAASTAAITGAAAAIVGGLLFDSNNRPYYNRGGRRYYVSAPVAREYRNGGGRYRGRSGGWHGHGGYHHHGG
jgi:hypothetical protein